MRPTFRHGAPAPDPSLGLSVEIVSLGHTALVEVSGELDLRTWPILLAEVTAPAHPTHHRILLDLSRVTFLDSEGLRGLLTVRDRLRRDGAVVDLAGRSRAVERITGLLGVDLGSTPHPGRGPEGAGVRARSASLR